jgi:2-keto-4-pentenoate hydratase/2-oxohepta-3-ene-1,7-dioic acid hydratase in catechol pathway
MTAQWIRHRTDDGPKWSPVPENGSPVTKAGPRPDPDAMVSFGPCKYDQLRVLLPATPTRVVALAHNYRDLVDEDADEIEPLVFLKTPSSVIGPGDEIQIPAETDTWAEVELAFVVDREARHVSPDEAPGYIRGYTVANDVTTESIQNRNWHLPRSKARETFCPVGPHLVTDVDTSDLAMRTRINDTYTQESTTRNQLYDEAEALALVSSLMTLEAGDLVLTGTPAGATSSIIESGDTVTVDIEALGALENPVGLSK